MRINSNVSKKKPKIILYLNATLLILNSKILIKKYNETLTSAIDPNNNKDMHKTQNAQDIHLKRLCSVVPAQCRQLHVDYTKCTDTRLVGVGCRPARVQGAAWTEGRRAPRPPSPGRYLYNRSLCVRRNVNTLTLPSPRFTTNGPKSVLVH